MSFRGKMKVTGIVAEYNPFHNGHEHQIKKAREITGADFIVVVLSGNFMQRGVPAIIDKYERARMALMGGADLVIEIPTCYATASAEYYSAGALSTLENLGVVDCLCFGSECGDIDILSNVAATLASESSEYKEVLKQKLKAGNSFPVARSQALSQTMNGFSAYSNVLGSPNNILGIEYIKSIIRRGYKIKPYTHMRIGSDYHSYRLSENLSSAIAIRESLSLQDDLTRIKAQVPMTTYEILEKHFHKIFPIFAVDFTSLIKFKLIREQKKGYTRYLDVTGDLSDRLAKGSFMMEEYEEFCNAMKTKDVTYARISRILCHILLDVFADEVSEYMDNGISYYARVLGFKESSKELLTAIKKNTSIPMITKVSEAKNVLYPLGMRMFEQDIYASHVYECLVDAKYGGGLFDEYRREVVKV